MALMSQGIDVMVSDQSAVFSNGGRPAHQRGRISSIFDGPYCGSFEFGISRFSDQLRMGTVTPFNVAVPPNPRRV